jgi:hypothetical protein
MFEIKQIIIKNIFLKINKKNSQAQLKKINGRQPKDDRGYII